MKVEHRIERKIAILFLACLCFSANAQNITSFEYFIDTDPGIGLATAANPPASPTVTDFNIPISVSSLSSGFHALYVRGKNTANNWTHTHSRYFYIVPPAIPLPTDITQMEYFIDTDPGVGVGTQVTGLTPSSTITNLPIAIDVTSLAMGFHTLYVRSKNNAGEWTHTHVRSFYVANISADNLVKFEYFFDTDPGFDNGTPAPVTPAAPSVTNIDIFAIPASLSIGTHTIYVRGKDSSGDWTQVITGTFVVTAALPPTITSFSPASGPIGTPVTIIGTNFSPIPANNEVRFNGVLTNATLSSATSITTSVPLGATTGKITVTVSGNTATSASDFTVTTTATIVFNTQPSNQIICEGNNATLSLAATGDTNLQYQWQIDNAGFTNLNNNLLYSGVNTAVLNITNPSISLSGSVFRCLVYGDNSISTASASASLSINIIPLAEITANGMLLSASPGDSYQWHQNGDAVVGATNQSFELNLLEYGKYLVDVTR